MPENRIYILTGPIQTGKTSSLVNWSANRKDVAGILTPVINGRRVFMNIYSCEQFPMEAGEGELEIFNIGRFIFSQAGFDKAIQILRKEMYIKGWLVIDEIGPLELRGEGFAEILKKILLLRKGRILLVVREGLVEKVKDYFGIDAIIIHKISEQTDV